MTLNPDLFVKALLTTDEYGSWQTSMFTSDDMIEEIRGINEDYKKLYQTDEDLIKIIDDEKEHLEECMEDYYNNKELQKEFNYNEELFKKKCIELYRELKQSLQDSINKN